MKHKPLLPSYDIRQILTFRELAELTQIKKTTLRTWLRDKKIPGAFRNGPGTRWQFRRAAVEQWWDEMNSEPK